MDATKKAVEAQSQVNPKKEAVMNEAPAVSDAVEAQSLSHTNTTTGEEAKMVAVTERGEVSPSSPSNPSEPPKKGGTGAKEGRSKLASRSAFDTNTAIAARLEGSRFRTAYSAMFAKSAAAAEALATQLYRRSYAHDAVVQPFNESLVEFNRRLGRLLALCRYLELDLDALLARIGLTAVQLRSRKPTEALTAAQRFAVHLNDPVTPVDEAMRERAQQVLEAARIASGRLKLREESERELTAHRQAFAAAVKTTSEDLALVAAEIRHTDLRQGTNWTEIILKPTGSTPRRGRSTETPVNTDPAALKEKTGGTG